MTSCSFNSNIVEEQIIYRPPFFYGNNYNYWKCRMQIYLKSINLDLWDIVINVGPCDRTARLSNGESQQTDVRKQAKADEKKTKHWSRHLIY